MGPRVCPPTTSIWFPNRSPRPPMCTSRTRRQHTHLHHSRRVCLSTRVGSTTQSTTLPFRTGNPRILTRNRSSRISTTSPSTPLPTTTRSTPPSTANQSTVHQQQNIVHQRQSTVLQRRSTARLRMRRRLTTKGGVQWIQEKMMTLVMLGLAVVLRLVIMVGESEIF